MCPICKSSRYLNPDMLFLVNPECYHKICSSCVDRIYSLGPAPCPYVGCGKTLRRNKFKQQLFEDVGVEREVDIRKRVFSIMNQREEDFSNKKDYDDYLEKIETIVFNLTNGVDTEKTETELTAYSTANRAAIMANFQKQKQEDDLQERKRQFDLQKRREMRKLELEAEQEERMEKELERKALINQLATSTEDASTITQKFAKSTLKRSSARKKLLELSQSDVAGSAFLSRGNLEDELADDKPFSPFNGDRQLDEPYSLYDDYKDLGVSDIASDIQFQASGFKVDDVYRRSLVDAFMGLGCNIEDEKAPNRTISVDGNNEAIV
ncbi:CDK-activating kinase assembly factor [Nadsonia fulvescens var. elongata DSM 6958]|uniref:RNA polymerase II transcription factor B subunit 3 n=1 Tax=Nadsonia fulvescens var. elongata DSM 6958 TaxID=857566 RepID=A0A1E3PGE8_9ASCO|nr:CDK-activating kinase assembly factor [Nadsonia fulvescens var. elongata DSM 6958]